MLSDNRKNWDWLVCYATTIGLAGFVAVLVNAGLFDRMIIR